MLDAVFSLYRRNFTLFFWITAAFLLIPNLALQIVSVHVFGASDLLSRMGDMLHSTYAIILAGGRGARLHTQRGS